MIHGSRVYVPLKPVIVAWMSLCAHYHETMRNYTMLMLNENLILINKMFLIY